MSERGTGPGEPAPVCTCPGHGSCCAVQPPPRRSRGPPGTCAVLLQSPDLGVQALECAGVLALQEQDVLLRTVQLVLQVCGCHPGIQVT